MQPRHSVLTVLNILLLMLSSRLLSMSSSIGPKMFTNVCMGGTYDTIHAGHKLLFNEAIKVCSKRLVVGITDNNMIKNKILWELIEPVEERIINVKRYLMSLNPNLTYEVVPISDIYGPAIAEKDLECIIVSDETIKGADKINQVRQDKSWPKLEINIVKLLPDTNSSNEVAKSQLKETKVSSSLIRFNKLGTIIHPPVPNDSLPKRPYLIGLTGGVASGKTTIGKYLESLGYGYINYDLLGHKTYSNPDLPVYKQIVDFFGKSVLNETDSQIDRSKLAKIVFNDKAKLEKLQEFVWPGIYQLVDEEIEQMKEKHDVIFLESALLIESGQTKRVHQIWSTIISPDEAIKRQMESRGLSKEEAQKRVEAQIDNLTRVRQSNAVFCSAWDVEVTRQQVQKCLKELKEKYLVD